MAEAADNGKTTEGVDTTTITAIEAETEVGTTATEVAIMTTTMPVVTIPTRRMGGRHGV